MQSNIISWVCSFPFLMQSMSPNYRTSNPCRPTFTENFLWMAQYLLMCERQHDRHSRKMGLLGTVLGQTGDTALCNMYLKRKQCDSLLYSVLPNWIRYYDSFFFFFLNSPTDVANVGKNSPIKNISQDLAPQSPFITTLQLQYFYTT